MKKMFAAVAVATALSSALAACHGKKPVTGPGDGTSSAAPSGESVEHKGGATGGATYGGRKDKDANH